MPVKTLFLLSITILYSTTATSTFFPEKKDVDNESFRERTYEECESFKYSYSRAKRRRDFGQSLDCGTKSNRLGNDSYNLFPSRV